jgi:hypothetical protein
MQAGSKETLVVGRLYRLPSPAALFLSQPRAQASRSTLCDTLSVMYSSPMFGEAGKAATDKWTSAGVELAAEAVLVVY